MINLKEHELQLVKKQKEFKSDINFEIMQIVKQALDEIKELDIDEQIEVLFFNFQNEYHKINGLLNPELEEKYCNLSKYMVFIIDKHLLYNSFYWKPYSGIVMFEENKEKEFNDLYRSLKDNLNYWNYMEIMKQVNKILKEINLIYFVSMDNKTIYNIDSLITLYPQSSKITKPIKKLFKELENILCDLELEHYILFWSKEKGIIYTDNDDILDKLEEEYDIDFSMDDK